MCQSNQSQSLIEERLRLRRLKRFIPVFLFPILGMAVCLAPDGVGAVPQTGFELSQGENHTTHEEEIVFLEAVAAGSPRVEMTVIGESLEARPIHLVRVGHPVPPPDEIIAAGRSILVIGGQHGNEPAGREMALILLRDLAFTDDPEWIGQLSQTTILFIPTANPDGRVADIRGNAMRVDTNRDHLALTTPEARFMAAVFRDFTPDIIVDAHEGPSTPNNPDQTPRLELSWPRNLNVHPEIRRLSEELVEDHVLPAIRAAGYTARVYGSPGGAGGGDERILRNVTGLRNSLGMLIETFGSTPKARADLQVLTVLEVLHFHRERTEEITTTLAHARAGAPRPVFWGGSDWEEPGPGQILQDPPCGYLLNSAQAGLLSHQLELFPLETESVGEASFFLPMDQPLRPVIPLLLDSRASHSMVDGHPLDDCADPGSEEPPGGPPPATPPARFFTDFSDEPAGQTPLGWSTVWRDSQWSVVGPPPFLRHSADGSSARRALAWERPGIVSGDVEVRTKVRFQSSNTYFQLPVHLSGEAGSENAYYVDVRRDTSTVRINRYLNGNFTTLGSAPFTAEQNIWYHVRFRREGSGIMVRIWEEGEEEPGDWQVTRQDTNHMAGKVGFAGFQSNSINDWAFLGVGTGGESAPDSCHLTVDLSAETTALAGDVWIATALAGGSGPFAFQWFWEGEELPQATGETFTLDPVLPSDAGWFTVLVTANCGMEASAGVELEVMPRTFSNWPSLQLLPPDRRNPDDRNGPFNLPNLLAYAMGLNPLTVRSEKLPRLHSMDLDAGRAVFHYRRSPFVSDAGLHLETSTDLLAWVPAGVSEPRVLESEQGWEKVEVEVAFPGGDAFFIRLKARFEPVP